MFWPLTMICPLVGPLDGGDELEQGALAGPGVAGEEDHLTLGDLEAHLGQGLVAAGVAFGYTVEFDHAQG